MSNEGTKAGRLFRRIVFSPPDGDCKLGLSLSGIRRSLQCLRQSLNLSTVTIDEEFEEMLIELNHQEALCKVFVELVHHYQACSLDMLERSFQVGDSMKQLFHPLFGKPNEPLDSSCDPLVNCKRYVAIIEENMLSLKETFSTIPDTIDTKFYHLFGWFDAIRKNTRKRDMALLDYDKVLDKFDPLSIKKSTGSLSIKQTKQFHILETQVDHFKLEYDKLNNMLKTELPYFFKLVSIYMDLMLQYVFYLQLTNTYQFNRSLLTLSIPMGFTKEEVADEEFGRKLVESWDPAKIEDQALGIISFRKIYLELLVNTHNAAKRANSRINFDPYFNYCVALFNFSAQSLGDLEFRKGDIIKVILSVGEWWQGELGDAVGMFPSNYVQMVTKQCK